MKELSKEWIEEQDKFKLENFIGIEKAFSLFFNVDEIVGTLTEAYYYELDDEDLDEETIQKNKDNVDDRILYTEDDRFYVVEHGQVVDFYELWESERYSVLEYLMKKMKDFYNYVEKKRDNNE